MANGVMFESRLFHCPTCNKLYYVPVRPDMPHSGTERICGKCWRRDTEESDDDRHSGPVDEYPQGE